MRGVARARLRVLSLVVLALVEDPTWAVAQSTTGLGLDDALRAAAAGPDVQALERALAVRVEGDRAISDVTGWTQIWVQPGVRILDAPDQGYTAQYYATHSWALADLAGAQRRAAGHERDTLSMRARDAGLGRRLEAGQAWSALWTAERQHAITRALAEAAAVSITTVERGVEAGVRTRADLAEARAFADDIELAGLAVEERLAEAQIALAAAIGRTDAPGLETSGEAPSISLPGEDALRARLDGLDALPDVQVRALAALATAARAEEVGAQYAPQLALGVQLQNEAPSGFSAFGIASLTFGAADLGARARASLEGEAALEALGVEAARVEARRRIELALHALEHEAQRTEAVRAHLVRDLEDLVAQRERALAAGEGTAFELFAARHRLAEARLTLEDAEGSLLAARLHVTLLMSAIPPPAERR